MKADLPVYPERISFFYISNGQIVIPKGARDLFGLTGGQRMVVLSDENGIALIPEEVFMSNMKNAMERSLEKQD